MANYIIDLKTKTISQNGEAVVLVKGEQSAQIITFECPSTFNNSNLRQMNIAVHSINADGQPDIDSTENGNVTLRNDGNKLIISWELGQIFTSVQGKGTFAVQFYKYKNSKSHEYSYCLRTKDININIENSSISSSNLIADTFKYQQFLTDRKIPYEYNKVFIIDNKTIRKLTQDNFDISTVGDSGVTKLYFIMNDTIDGVRLSSINSLTFMVYYMTPSGIVSYDTSISSYYYQKDGYVLLTWEIPYDVCLEKGNVNFSIGFTYSQNNNLKKWFTQSFSIEILDSVAVIDESNIGEINNSKLDELLSKIEVINTSYNVLDTKIETAIQEINELYDNVQTLESEIVNYAVEAEKSAESAASSLEDLKNTVINIHNSVEGNVVSVADASDKKIDEINVYGKSSQASTPTMTAPVDIEDPFDSLTASVYAANKNLLSTQYTKDNPLTLTADKDKYTYYPPVSYKAVVIKGVTYTFSYETDGVAGTEGDTTDTVHAAAFDADNHIWYTTRNKNYVTFVAKETGLLSFRVGINMNGCTHSFWNFQVEMGDVKTDYAAGERQSIDITLTEPLRGIAVDAGGNYTDNTGQQYFADVICEQNGEIGVLRNVEKVRVTGEITQVASYPNRGLVVYKTPANYSNYSNSIKAGICTHFNYSSALSEGSINRTVDNKINIVTADTYTVDEINTFFNDNEVYIYLCLSNPVFEPFEEEIQNQFKALTAYYGITNVCNSEGAHTRLNYTADTKLYIDNKFNELAKAITATESEV